MAKSKPTTSDEAATAALQYVNTQLDRLIDKAADAPACPVERLKAEQCTLVRALNGMNTALSKNEPDIWNLEEMINDRMDANEASASALRARSPKGAVFQVDLIASLVEDLRSYVPQDSSDSRDASAAMRKILRMLYSIRNVLLDGTSDMVDEHYMAEVFDPHRHVHDAVLATFTGKPAGGAS